MVILMYGGSKTGAMDIIKFYKLLPQVSFIQHLIPENIQLIKHSAVLIQACCSNKTALDTAALVTYDKRFFRDYFCLAFGASFRQRSAPVDKRNRLKLGASLPNINLSIKK